jgi:SAM-dependent methyltransferase
MSVFGVYSRYYNLLYKDKDYAGEARYVDALIQKHAPGAQSILDLGCGTGRHDFELDKLGYVMTGVDISEEMIAIARSGCATGIPSPRFTIGDIRSVRLNLSFDVVIALFHVMSYQVTNADLSLAFATAKANLKPGGLFIFDCWYGPAVLTDLPVVRVKRLEDEEISAVRIADPVMHYNENVVDVNYEVMITDKITGLTDKINETHRMRYLFMSEIQLLLEHHGMRAIYSGKWLSPTPVPAGNKTWSVFFIVQMC